MTAIQVRTGGVIRVEKLTRTQSALIGPRDAVKAEVARMEAAHYPVRFDRPQRVDGGGLVVVLTLIPSGERAPIEPALPWWHHPGWIVSVLLSATALVAVTAWLLSTLVSALVALVVPILGVLVILGLIVVVPKLAGGDRYSMTMNIHK